LKGLLSQQSVPRELPCTTPREETLTHISINVPPSPAACIKEDYEQVTYWTLGKWKDFKTKNPDHGKLDFLTDDYGEKVIESRLKEMSVEAHVLFNELYRYCHDPFTWSTGTAIASSFFS